MSLLLASMPLARPAQLWSRLLLPLSLALPSLIFNTQKKKRTPFRVRQRHTAQAKELQTWTDWYDCPLCKRPKLVGRWCEREECRDTRP